MAIDSRNVHDTAAVRMLLNTADPQSLGVKSDWKTVHEFVDFAISRQPDIN